MTPQERRLVFRGGLSVLYLPYYEALCAELNFSWAPYISARTFAEQDALFRQGREGRPGLRVTDARGGESAHNYGCASDWAWFDENGRLQWLKKEDSRWNIYVNAVQKVGLRSGKEFPAVDIDHNELKISCSWKQILVTFKQVNMKAAQEHIARNMITAP